MMDEKMSLVDEKRRFRREPLQIAICTENFSGTPTDGVTRTLGRLLHHLQAEGHEAILLGPETGLSTFAGYELIGTRGIPLVIYPGLKLNFFRPRFIRRLIEFDPDVVHFVDPIWLGGQVLPAISHFLPETGLVASYHTNLAQYATLFGFSYLTPLIWRLQRFLHGRCSLTFCPSNSTKSLLESKGFDNVRIWARGVDSDVFSPSHCSQELRKSWNVGPSVEGGPEKTVVLYVGRISWEKNLRLLVEAYRGLDAAAARAAGPSYSGSRLVFVGDGPAREELAKLCLQYGIDAVFMGHRKGAELSACFASSDVFAFPSYTETFGQVVLEALSSGLPVVALKAEGVCDIVTNGQTGYLLDAETIAPHLANGDINTLVSPSSSTFSAATALFRDLLVKLVTDAPLRQSMQAKCLAEASKHSWWETMEKVVQGYADIRDSQRNRLSRHPSRSPQLRPVKRSRSPSPIPMLAPASRRVSAESMRLISAEEGKPLILATERATRRMLATAQSPFAYMVVFFFTFAQALVWLWRC